jgi:hypothetical protein
MYFESMIQTTHGHLHGDPTLIIALRTKNSVFTVVEWKH